MVVVGVTLTLVGCGSTASQTGTAIPEKTILTYAISPQKTYYDAGETVTVTATKTGPEDVGVAWGFSLQGASQFPTTTKTTFSVKTGTSGFRMIVTGKPERTRTVNGVSLIEGTATFNIQVL